MTFFQFFLAAGFVLLVLIGMRFLRRDHSLALKRLLAICFAGTAIFAVLFPNALTAFARFLGVGRGTDLLLYLSVIAGLCFIIMVVRVKARTDEKLTQLTRALALAEARLTEHLERQTSTSLPEAEQLATGKESA